MLRFTLAAALCLALAPGCSLFADGRPGPPPQGPPTVDPPSGEDPPGEDPPLDPPDDDPPDEPRVGCPNTTYPDWATSPYVLPYAVGTAYRVNLSHCSGSYHGEGLPDAFAIDFAMDIGTPVTASRAGRVVYVVESGHDGDHPNNLVIVDHRDRTFAQYMHLTHDGAVVEVGAWVQPGDLLGYSGNTGLAGYPHLHLVVTEDLYGWPYTSLPVTFSNTTPNPYSLESGESYPALPY